MKKALFFHSLVAALCYCYTFVVISSSLSGCKKQADSVAPDESAVIGYNNLPYAAPETEGSFTVTAGLCRNTLPAEPVHLTVDLFYFDLNTDPQKAITQLTDPVDTEDEDGPDAQEIREPDQSFDLFTRTTDEKGMTVTNYQPDKSFVFQTGPQSLCVVRLTDELGNESFSWFLTTKGSSLKTCLNL